ncbi:MAG: adenine deaminase C-terminal domain-containing protein, partial [Aestuariivirga sp.]
TLPIDLVMARGRVLAEGGKLTADIPAYRYPATARDTVKVQRKLKPSDFDIAAPSGANHVTARVIGVIENQAPTRALERRLAVRDGLVEMAADVAQVALVERHRATGTVTNGFVSGFGYNVPCAVASTVAHDSHHMIVVGTDKASMALAANTLIEAHGGVAVVRGQEVMALIELPIAGLMSEERAERVAVKTAKMVEAMRSCGCRLNTAFMQHSLLALVVIPELRISDAGLIDTVRFKKTSLFI